MKRIFNSIISYIIPAERATIGLTSFRIKKQIINQAPKPKIKETSSLNFGLLHK